VIATTNYPKKFFARALVVLLHSVITLRFAGRSHNNGCTAAVFIERAMQFSFLTLISKRVSILKDIHFLFYIYFSRTARSEHS